MRFDQREVAIIERVIDDWLSENDYTSTRPNHNNFVADVLNIKTKIEQANSRPPE